MVQEELNNLTMMNLLLFYLLLLISNPTYQLNKEQIIGDWYLSFDPDSFEIDKMSDLGFFEKQIYKLFAAKKIKASMDSSKTMMSFLEDGKFNMKSAKSTRKTDGTWKVENGNLVIEPTQKETKNDKPKQNDKKKFSINFKDGRWFFKGSNLFFYYKQKNELVNSGMYLKKELQKPV